MQEKISYNLEAIIKLVAAGDEPAFRQLFELYHKRIYSFSLYLTRSEVMAEEVSQEIFIKIWNNRDQLATIKVFEAWLMTIVRNQCYTFLNRLSKEQLILQEMGKEGKEGEATNCVENNFIDDEFRQLFRKTIEQLPEQQRKVFILSRQQGIKNKDIAIEMGISIHTVKCHKKAAIKNLQIMLGSQLFSIISMFGSTISY